MSKKSSAPPRKAARRSAFFSGFVAGNFSAYYIGLAMVALMSIGYLISNLGLGGVMIAAPVFAFGLVAFGFLGMAP